MTDEQTDDSSVFRSEPFRLSREEHFLIAFLWDVESVGLQLSPKIAHELQEMETMGPDYPFRKDEAEPVVRLVMMEIPL